MSLPVTRPIGRALVVASASSRSQSLNALQRLGYSCAEADDPYGAMLEVCRRPLVYRALILSMTSLFKEELAMIETVKRRFPHIEVWLTQTDGRQASMAEAMRLGADGFLSEDGLHRIAITPGNENAATTWSSSKVMAGKASEEDEHSSLTDQDISSGEPVLTADELRALLQEQPGVE